MPGGREAVFVGVHEGGGVGHVGVVVEDVAQVGEGLAAFVDGGVEGGGDVVDDIDVWCPAVGGMSALGSARCSGGWLERRDVLCELSYPRGVLSRKLRHDHGPIRRWRRWRWRRYTINGAGAGRCNGSVWPIKRSIGVHHLVIPMRSPRR